MCYCPETQKKFREWCKKRCKTLDTLLKAWRRRGREQMLETPFNQGIIARLWSNRKSPYLWLVNQGRDRQRVTVRFNPRQACITDARPLRGAEAVVGGNSLTAVCEGWNAAVYELYVEQGAPGKK